MSLTDYVIMPGTDYQGICDAVRAKNGEISVYKSGELAPAIERIISGGSESSGISATKFIDVDIAVDASTATKVKYTIEGLELLSSIENPTKHNAFSMNDIYIAFVIPKEISDETGEENNIYRKSFSVIRANTDYSTNIFNVLYYGGNTTDKKYSTSDKQYGICSINFNSKNVIDGKIIGNLDLYVVHHNVSGFEVLAGTYNIQVFLLENFDWSVV